MHGFMRIEKLEESGDWSTQHEGEFLFPDEETIDAASVLLAAFADFNSELAPDTLRLCVWPNKMPARERELNNVAAMFTLGTLRITESDGNIWTHAAHLLRWGAFKSFSCQDSHMPLALVMGNVPLPAPFAGALQASSNRRYWYYPADGEDTSCDSKQRFDAVIEGYYEAWLTLRSSQDSSTWKPGEAHAIGERLKNGEVTFMIQELHNRLGTEADQALHELVKTREEAVKDADDDQETIDRIRRQFQSDVRVLYYKHANA